VNIGPITAVPVSARVSVPTLVPLAAASAAAPTAVDVRTTEADLDGLRAAHAAHYGNDPNWSGPLSGPFTYELEHPTTGERTTVRGTARIYHAAVAGDEWALVPFVHRQVGTMHQPGVYHKVDGAWTVVSGDPAPGELEARGIPAAILRHWNIQHGMPPADVVVDDHFRP
jgi:hypothetical protein